MKAIKICVFSLLIVISAYCFELDDLLRKNPEKITRDSLEHRSFARCRYKREMICYNDKVKFLGTSIKEAVIRFTREGFFESADITLGYRTNEKEWKDIQKQAEETCKKITDILGKQSWEFTHFFPNQRRIKVRCWNTGQISTRMFSHVANYKGSGELSFISIRIQTKSLPLPEIRDAIKIQSSRKVNVRKYDGGKLLPIPMRRQHGGTCWVTTLARQLNYLGSEIMPLMLLVALDGGGDKQIKNLGKLYGFTYSTMHINHKQDSTKNCLEFISLYNQKAKQKGIPIIKTNQSEGNTAWVGNMDLVNLPLAKSLKLKSLSDKKYQQFRKMVITSIDQNIPIGWTVARHNGGSKHRRLIIGYNLSKDLIYYSDSWGTKDHLKEMHFITAYLESLWCQFVQ